MATMQDVAKRARVSITTVSRVLNGDPRVKAETRARVEAVISATGYQPNLMARALRQQKSGVIGLVVDTLANPFTAELGQAVSGELESAGYQLVLADTHRRPHKASEFLQVLAQRGVDGILYAAGWDTNPEELAVQCQMLQKSQIPVVVVGNILPSVTSVSVDHRQGVAKAVRYLYSRGHRHLAFVGGAQNSETTRLREQGYIEATQALGINSRLYTSRGLLATANEAAVRVPREFPEVTALVAASDYVAVGILHGLFVGGYQVPRDVSVIGFDNIDISQFLCPALTTVTADIPRMAEIACARLYSAMTEPQTLSSSVTVEPQIVERQSSGPPPFRT
jgi:LacI family transcriptional regulator